MQLPGCSCSYLPTSPVSLFNTGPASETASIELLPITATCWVWPQWFIVWAIVSNYRETGTALKLHAVTTDAKIGQFLSIGIAADMAIGNHVELG